MARNVWYEIGRHLDREECRMAEETLASVRAERDRYLALLLQVKRDISRPDCPFVRVATAVRIAEALHDGYGPAQQPVGAPS